MSDETTQPVPATASEESTSSEAPVELSSAETPVEAAESTAPAPICYIGNDAVIEAEKEGDFTTVKLANGTQQRMHNLLFDKMISPEANPMGGSVRDMLCSTIAKEIIALFTVYDLTLSDSDLALNYAGNNATNLKRSSDKKLWNGKRPEDVTYGDMRNVLA